MSGILYLVATPIGNRDDMTVRAADTLRQADVIVAEDTRHSGKLLGPLHISKPMVSYHDHNKERVTPKLTSMLEDGRCLALITDAGTPGIADPAFYLVRACIQKGIEVTTLPGPCAAISALTVSGLPTDRFVFENFCPRNASKRRSYLRSLSDEKRTIILYESPFRIIPLLEAMLEIYGDIHVVIVRELTKKFEEILRGKVQSALERFASQKPKGEFVVLFNLRESRKKPKQDLSGGMPVP